MKYHWLKVTAGIALVTLVAPLGQAEDSGSGSGSLRIEKVQDLSFGSFAAGSGGSVTIAANASGEHSRSPGGNVWLVPSDEGQAAQFTVRGFPYTNYTIQLPSNDVILTGSEGGEMVLNKLTSSLEDNQGQVGGLFMGDWGRQTLWVGGTLAVNPNQTPGNYTGTFTVMVNYN